MFKFIKNMSNGIFGVILMVMVITGGGFKLFNSYFGKVEPVPTVFISEILDIQELATIKYNYMTNLIYYKKRPKIPLIGCNVPFTESRTVLSVAGRVKVGIDLNDVKINQTANQVLITMPQAKILSHEFDLPKFQVLYEDTSLFNLPDAADYLEFIRSQKTRIEQTELSENILTQADEKARNIILARIKQIDNRLNVHFAG